MLMKKAILMLALFPFLHETTYPVEYVSCKPNEIMVRHEDETIQISLFNTQITNDDGWETTCNIIKDAKKLNFELDPTTKIDDPLSVYLFADGKLVQETIIETKNAYPMIHNPEYTYEAQLESAAALTQVMAKPDKKNIETTYPIMAPLVLLVCMLLWVVMFSYIVFKLKKKKRIKKNN